MGSPVNVMLIFEQLFSSAMMKEWKLRNLKPHGFTCKPMSKSSFTDCKTRANLEDAEVKVWRQIDNLQSFQFCDIFSENFKWRPFWPNIRTQTKAISALTLHPNEDHFGTQTKAFSAANLHPNEGHFGTQTKAFSAANWHPNEDHFGQILAPKRRPFRRRIGTQMKTINWRETWQKSRHT